MEDSAWLNKMKKKVEEEMARKEAEVVSYWKGEIEKILAKKHEGLGALQLEMQQFLQRMQNRIKVLRQSLGGWSAAAGAEFKIQGGKRKIKKHAGKRGRRVSVDWGDGSGRGMTEKPEKTLKNILI
jgi:hypothetical protein